LLLAGVLLQKLVVHHMYLDNTSMLQCLLHLHCSCRHFSFSLYISELTARLISVFTTVGTIIVADLPSAEIIASPDEVLPDEVLSDESLSESAKTELTEMPDTRKTMVNRIDIMRTFFINLSFSVALIFKYSANELL